MEGTWHRDDRSCVKRLGIVANFKRIIAWTSLSRRLTISLELVPVHVSLDLAWGELVLGLTDTEVGILAEV